jgi:hypothetical protein
MAGVNKSGKLMESSNSQISQLRKTLMSVLTAILWLATVGLGMLAFMVFQQGLQVRSGLLLLEYGEMGAVARAGFWRIIRYTSLFLGGIGWLAMVVGGMEYHFRRIGQRQSFRIFAWTIGIEIALIVAGIALQIS